MDENEQRVERIKRALGCKTDTELAEKINSHPPNISRWKQRGFYSTTSKLIDALIEENRLLHKEVRQLKKKVKE